MEQIVNCLKADTAHQMHLLKEKFKILEKKTLNFLYNCRTEMQINSFSFADFLKICLKLNPNLDGKLLSDSILAPEVLIASCLPCYLLS